MEIGTAGEAVEATGRPDSGIVLEDEESIELSADESAAIDALLAGAASASSAQAESAVEDEAVADATSASLDAPEWTLDGEASEVSASEATAESEHPATWEQQVSEAAASAVGTDLPLDSDIPDRAEFDSVSEAVDASIPESIEITGLELEAIELGEAHLPSDLLESGFGLESEQAEDSADLVLIDPDLFEILKGEVAGHLDTVEAYLQRSVGGPQPVEERLLRAVHTISGAFAMTEVEVGTELAWPLEGYIKRLLAQAAAPSMVGFECIEEAAQALRALMIELDQPMPRPQRHTRLAQRISALRDALPEPTRPVVDTGMDDDQTADSPVYPVSADTFALAASAPTQVTVAEALQDTAHDSVAASEDKPARDELPAGLLGDLPPAGELDALAGSGELSFASEFESAEPIRPEEQAQSADFEIIETEGGAQSPYWTDTESASLQPAVESGLTLDELGEADSADAWLAAFEAEVTGEGAKPALPVDTASEQSLHAQSDSEDALLIHSMLSEEALEQSAGAGTSAPSDFESEALLESLLAEEPPAELQDESAITVEAVELADWNERANDESKATVEPATPELASPDAHGSEIGVYETLDAPIAEVSDELSPADAGRGELQAELESATPILPVDTDSLTMELESIELVAGSEGGDAVLEEQGFEDEGFPDAEAQAAVAEVLDGRLDTAEHESADAAAESMVAEDAPEPASEVDANLADAFVELELAEEEAPELAPATDHAPAAEAAASAAALPATQAPKLAIPTDVDPDGPLDLTDVDEDLLDVFLEEGVDILDHSDGLMSRLREAPQEQELVVGLQRDLHTLKGGARMAGLNPIGDLAHVTESLLEVVAAGGRDLGSSGVEVLERAFDRLHSLVSRVGERRAIATPVHLLAAVETLLRGEALPTVEAAAEPLASIEPTAPSESAPARQVPPPIRMVPTETALDEEETVTRAPQEQIRIRADLLDRLVNYAGEVAIYRARLEQQLGAFRGNLGELDQTTTRLREQLRKLEIETEAQILSRYQRQQDEGDTQFDPLELDRFSTLQQLSRALSESASDIVNLQGTLEDLTRQYETLLLQQSRVSSDLQEGLMRTRMVPFDSLVPRLRRILRQTAGELGKQAQLKVEGAQGEMDRNVLDRMTAPLEHMLRNALAHGLETPADRIAAGKPAEGNIRVQVAREASEVLIRVSDDGRGLDRDAIRRKAIERGLMKADAQLGDRDLYGFILESGFSTASSVSKIAGRGVGMDVVYSEIRQLGGSLHIESERGRGTEFVIRLPFTLAVTQAVFVKQGETSFAVPITSVQGVSRIDREELDKQLASGAPVFSYAGEDYAIHDLGLLLGQPAAKAADSLQVPVLLARSGDQRAAICVDNVLGSREIVVKPTGPQVSSIPGIFGATIMGDGRVVVILDVAPLVRRAAAIEHAPVATALEDQRVVPLVMVVDDSITMRKVTGRVLERHNFEVLTAKDGVDAIEKLAERVPDVMLLDIEMPRMDGYELATHMRNDPRLKSVPIIMITSRTGDKHRQRAFEIGVDRYLGKPYQEADLMRNVQEILQVQRERGR
jgi:chemosensory pili system protein ChpA (sensor histidine kinase/response regulator)